MPLLWGIFRLSANDWAGLGLNNLTGVPRDNK